MRAGLCAAFAIGLAVLGGCAVGPTYRRPEAASAAQWTPEPPWRVGSPEDDVLKGAWWEIFRDRALDTLETRALEQGQTVQAARARLDQARAQARATASLLFPELDLDTNATRLKTSRNRPLANYGVPNQSTVQNDFVLGFQVHYEADLFGGIRRQVESARAQADAARADLENARLVLTAEVAADYYDLRELDLEIDVVAQSVELQRRALQFVQARHDLGDASGLDLAQQQAQLDSTTTQIELLRNQRAQYEHALATLTGAAAPTFSIDAAVVPLAVPAIPVALPSDVLERRPDVASSERAVAAANAQIGVAEAAYFPSIPLTAGVGHESNATALLFNAPSLFWSFGVAATTVVFDAGRIDANVAAAKASYAATVANYRQTVLTAMQEVEDGLTGLDTLGRAAAQADAAVGSAQRVLDLANDRYSGGVATYLDVITAQQALLTNQRQSAQIRGQQMVTAVYLVKAVGGGWADALPDTTARAAPQGR